MRPDVTRSGISSQSAIRIIPLKSKKTFDVDITLYSAVAGLAIRGGFPWRRQSLPKTGVASLIESIVDGIKDPFTLFKPGVKDSVCSFVKFLQRECREGFEVQEVVPRPAN